MKERRPFLGSYGTFQEAFPQIESIKVDLEQDKFGFYLREDAWRKKSRYSDGNLPAHIDCCNRYCQRGGFDIQTFLWTMTHSKEINRQFDLRCNGDEGSPGGRRKGKSCMNSAKVEITITYKEAQSCSR